MSFYIRKSLRAGPFRFNLSKSGIGVSAGITGLRVGSGPRGNYVHVGRHGFYYRQTLPSTGEGRRTSTSPIRPTLQPTHSDISAVQMEQIESFAPAFLCAAFPLLAVFGGIITFLAYRQDQVSKTVVLFYGLDVDAEHAYQVLHDAFKKLTRCSRVWHIEAQGKIRDLQIRKREAGASTLVQRKPVQLACQAPPYVSTNLSIPTIPVGRQSLYFFPDRVLVYEKGKVGAVSYGDIQLRVNNTRFIEEEWVPQDAKIVDYTWKYVNKGGGPDRRFKNNRQLPIALYGELYFTSRTGLNELIQVSKPDIGSELLDAFRKLDSLQSSA